METHFSVENKPLLNQEDILLQVYADTSIQDYLYLPLCTHTENQLSELTLWSLQKTRFVYLNDFLRKKEAETNKIQLS